MTVTAIDRLLALSSRRRASPRGLWLAAFVGVACALVVATAWAHGQRAAHREAEAAAAGHGSTPVPTAAESLPRRALPPDFAVRFGPDAGLAQWAHDVQRTAAQLGVSLLTVSNTVASPQADRLGRNDIQLLLRGAYPQIKLLLKETLDRHPNTSVVRLNMRSVSSGAEVEASVTLVRWSAPLPSEPNAASRTSSS